MENFWIVSICAFVGMLGVPLLVEGMFWCFAWCFCKVDDYFRERYMRIIMENMCRLERIAEEAEREAA